MSPYSFPFSFVQTRTTMSGVTPPQLSGLALGFGYCASDYLAVGGPLRSVSLGSKKFWLSQRRLKGECLFHIKEGVSRAGRHVSSRPRGQCTGSSVHETPRFSQTILEGHHPLCVCVCIRSPRPRVTPAWGQCPPHPLWSRVAFCAGPRTSAVE